MPADFVPVPDEVLQHVPDVCLMLGFEDFCGRPRDVSSAALAREVLALRAAAREIFVDVSATDCGNEFHPVRPRAYAISRHSLDALRALLPEART
jgi:hypothetical protein